jgi:hypothetical protein
VRTQRDQTVKMIGGGMTDGDLNGHERKSHMGHLFQSKHDASSARHRQDNSFRFDGPF